jgi:hypothetical protein
MKILAAALLCVLAAGCAAPLPPSSGSSIASPAPTSSAPNPNLAVSNGTTLTVTVLVNGQRIGDFPPDRPDPNVDVAGLPPLPWNVEVRSPSGRLIVAFPVRRGSEPQYNSAAVFVDLSCGRLWLSVGAVVPDAPVPPSPGKPGDCAP